MTPREQVHGAHLTSKCIFGMLGSDASTRSHHDYALSYLRV